MDKNHSAGDGRTEAKAIARPHGPAPGAAQGVRALVQRVSAVSQPAAAASRVPGVRELQRARGAGH